MATTWHGNELDLIMLLLFYSRRPQIALQDTNEWGKKKVTFICWDNTSTLVTVRFSVG